MRHAAHPSSTGDVRAPCPREPGFRGLGLTSKYRQRKELWALYGFIPPSGVALRINNLATVNSREQAKQTYTQQQSNKGVAGRTSLVIPSCGLDVGSLSIGSGCCGRGRCPSQGPILTVPRRWRHVRAPPKLYRASARRKVTEGHGRPPGKMNYPGASVKRDSTISAGAAI